MVNVRPTSPNFITRVGMVSRADASQGRILSGPDKPELSNALHALAVIKESDESVSSSTTLQEDDDLTVDLRSNTTYVINALIRVDSASSSPDIKYGFNAPAGSTVTISWFGVEDPAGNFAGGIIESTGDEGDSIQLDPAQQNFIRFFGTVQVGVAGALTFKWAQNVSDATSTDVLQFSSLSATFLRRD